MSAAQKPNMPTGDPHVPTPADAGSQTTQPVSTHAVPRREPTRSAPPGREVRVPVVPGYKVLRELGQGGMGAVYLARREATGEDVALKVMLPRVTVHSRGRKMFLREMENTQVLRHPHIVRLDDAGYWEGTFFLTLEYCDGGSVDGLMRSRGGPLPVSEAVPIVLQCLDGMDYAHQAELPRVPLADGRFGQGRGLVHRDLKPANLFLCGSGPGRVAKVGDFGLAKAFDLAGLSGQTSTGSGGGTPAFMPRQQVINFKYARPDVDLWALAASLYYMLTGVYPRDFPPGKDPCQHVVESRAMPIRQRDPAIPRRLADVLDHALLDQPTIPFQSAAEFKRALSQAL